MTLCGHRIPFDTAEVRVVAEPFNPTHWYSDKRKCVHCEAT